MLEVQGEIHVQWPRDRLILTLLFRSRVGAEFKMSVTNSSTGIFNRVTRIDLLVILILPLNVEIRVLQKAYGPLRSTE